MIAKADEYLEVDTSGCEGCITGQLLPNRSKGTDGKGWIVRYEDLLFLKEGKMERLHWKDGPGQKETRPPRSISIAKANEALRLMGERTGGLREGDWCDAQTQIGEGEGWTDGAVKLKEIYNEGNKNDVVDGNPDCLTEYAGMTVAVELENAEVKNHVMSRTNFLAAYRNLGKLTRTTEIFEVSNWVRERMKEARFDDDGEIEEETTSDWYDGSGNLWEEQASHLGAKMIETENALPELPTRPYAKRARLLTCMGADYLEIKEKEDEEGSYIEEVRDRAWTVAIELTVGEGGKLEWPGDICERLVDMAFEQMGKKKIRMLAPFGENSNELRRATVMMENLGTLIVDHEFPATPEEEETEGAQG